MNEPTLRRSRKRVRVTPGQVVAVPLSDGTIGLGHVVHCDGHSMTFVVLGVRDGSVEALGRRLDEAVRCPIGVLVTGDGFIRDGDWPIVDERPPDYDFGFTMPKNMDGKSGYYTPIVVRDFVDAYYGLRPWDEWPMSPIWNRKILLPYLPIPATARFQGAPGAPRPPPPKPPPVTDGPALVTIQLVYPGTGMPSTDLVRRRQDFERRIEAAGAGEVDGAETGAGVMEIFLRTGDVRSAVALVEKIAEETGWKDDMLIETAPLDGEDEDEDESEGSD
jgi:hypothetical protein